MLDRRFIRENPQAVKDAVRVKGINLDVDELLALDSASRDLQRELDDAQARRKSFSKEFARASEDDRVRLKAEHEEQDRYLRNVRERLADTSEKLRVLLLLTPTTRWDGAPVGDESANATIRVWGEPPSFDFEPKDHVELLESRGWAEFGRARKVAGERAYALRGDMVLLERAMLSYALDHLIATGSRPPTGRSWSPRYCAVISAAVRSCDQVRYAGTAVSHPGLAPAGTAGQAGLPMPAARSGAGPALQAA